MVSDVGDAGERNQSPTPRRDGGGNQLGVFCGEHPIGSKYQHDVQPDELAIS